MSQYTVEFIQEFLKNPSARLIDTELYDGYTESYTKRYPLLHLVKINVGHDVAYEFVEFETLIDYLLLRQATLVRSYCLATLKQE